ncbi:MAG: NrfD/PsrC family molybdoenzyme membrane anchor subunit [Anaerolineae bacterium]
MTTMTKAQKRSLPVGLLVPAAIAVIGMAVWVARFALGLGRATNLSDAYPWGLWIGFDDLSGAALGAGAFVVAATVYIFNLKRCHPLLRPTLLTGFLGYLLVMLGLLADLAKPQNFWHPFIYWNWHSVMLLVFWCVILYTVVMALEFSPVVFERLGWQVPLRIIRAIQIPLVIIGVILSTLHQSSLGSLFLLLRYRLHPLWYSSLLPVFFFTSAVAVGLAMVILESVVSAKALKRPLEKDLLSGLASAVPYVLGIYFVLQVIDLLVAGEFGLMLEGSVRSTLFLVEMVLGVLLPAVLFAIPGVRQSAAGLFWGALLVVGGLILNRLDVSVIGQIVPTGSYFPHWMEFAVTIGLLASGVVAYTLITHYFPVFEEEVVAEPVAAELQAAAG